MNGSHDDGGRCPACRARVAPGDAWCSLCHTSLRAAAGPPAAPATRTVPTMPNVPGRSDEEAARVAAEADRMLAELAASGDGVTRLHGAVVRRTGDAHRLVLAAGLGLAALVLVVGGLTLLGALL